MSNNNNSLQHGLKLRPNTYKLLMRHLMPEMLIIYCCFFNQLIINYYLFGLQFEFSKIFSLIRLLFINSMSDSTRFLQFASILSKYVIS